MIDKEKYTSFIQDEDTKRVVFKNISKIEGVLKHHDVRKTDFMNPFEQKLFISVLNAFSNDVSYELFGGNIVCERKIFLIYPNYMPEPTPPIKLLRLSGNFKFEKITHRDCLGALMSVGIVREKTGDIFINDDFIDVVIDESLSNYIATNLTSIRRCSIKSSVLDISNLIVSKSETTNKSISVPSLRLDAIISEALNISRASSCNLIKANKVKVNYEPILSPSKEIEENSLISVKGYGRFMFLSNNGLSKKSKFRLSIQIYK